MMVGILFIFLLMLTVFALNYRDAERDQVVALDRYERLRLQNERLQTALDAVIARLQQEIREREQGRAELLDRLKSELERHRFPDGRRMQVRIDQQSGVLRLSEDVPFNTGSADLLGRAQQTVQVLAETLGRILPCFTNGTTDRSRCGPRDAPILEAVFIEGHTDQQGFTNQTAEQSVLQNDRLSASRALSVFAELRRLQPSLDELRNADGVPLLGLSGYGQRRPVAWGTTEVAFAQNRRIDLRFLLSSRTSEEVQRLIEQVEALRRLPP
nr:OmpA family protein [Neoroseomonas alba]